MSAKFHHNIPHSSRDRATFTFFRIWIPAKPRPTQNVSSQSFGLDLVNINVYAKYSTQFKRKGHLHFFFRIWHSANPRPMINVILQFLRLDLFNSKLSANFYQNIPNALRVKFHFLQNLNLGKPRPIPNVI